jgi:hypothetical protein
LPQTSAYTHDVSSGVIDPSGDIGVFFNNIFSSPKTAPYYLIGNGDGTFVNKSSTFLPAVLHTISPAYTWLTSSLVRKTKCRERRGFILIPATATSAA